MSGLTFTVEGKPAPQGSKRIGRNRATGAPILLDDDDGWLVREAEDPAKVPCYTYRGRWEQPGQTWEPA